MPTGLKTTTVEALHCREKNHSATLGRDRQKLYSIRDRKKINSGVLTNRLFGERQTVAGREGERIKSIRESGR